MSSSRALKLLMLAKENENPGTNRTTGRQRNNKLLVPLNINTNVESPCPVDNITDKDVQFMDTVLQGIRDKTPQEITNNENAPNLPSKEVKVKKGLTNKGVRKCLNFEDKTAIETDTVPKQAVAAETLIAVSDSPMGEDTDLNGEAIFSLGTESPTLAVLQESSTLGNTTRESSNAEVIDCSQEGIVISLDHNGTSSATFEIAESSCLENDVDQLRDSITIEEGASLNTESPTVEAGDKSSTIDNMVRILSDLNAEGIDTSEGGIAVMDLDNPIIECLVETEHLGGETEAGTNQPKPKRKRSAAPPTEGSPKRRKVNPSVWKRNTAKQAKEKGLAHTTLKGKIKDAKRLGPGCGDRCSHKCHQNVSQEERQKIFDQFYSIEETSRKWDFVGRLVTAKNVERRTTDRQELSRRKYTYNYYFIIGNNVRVQVCKKFFLDTLDQSEQIIKTSLHKQEGKSGTISPDKRGKFKRVEKASTNTMKNSVRSHIESYKPVESHYCRKDSKCKYLPETLSIRKMHSMYMMERGENTPNTASYRQYADIFNSEYYIKFQSPKKDMCSLCMNWKYKTPEEKEQENDKNKYEIHRSNRARGYEMMLEDSQKPKNDTLLCVASFDFQKILESPKGKNDDFYYRSKLKCYNFSVFDNFLNEGYCYVWDQTLALKSATEVASCVYDFILRRVEAGKKKFIFYSDNCWSQNKNQFLFSMYNMATHKHDLEICHRYLEKGHTHMEVDNMHALIERTTKDLDVFTPSQWYALMRAAKKTGKKYTVIEADQNLFKNFKPAAEHHNWSKARVSKIRELQVCKNRALVKYNYDDDAEELAILSVRPGRRVNWETFQLKNCYDKKFAIPKKPLRDIKWFVEKGHIPTAYIPFYERLFTEQDNLEAAESECEDDCDCCNSSAEDGDDAI